LTVYLVRHAQAGERAKWEGTDLDRPLSGRGKRQAKAIADRLDDERIVRLVSSPYRRCVQTLEPLGTSLGLAVETDDRLSEGASFEDTLALIDELGDGAALCSHGDVIPDTMSALVRRGVELEGEPDWRKATVWVIDRDATGGGSAHALPPPDRAPV